MWPKIAGTFSIYAGYQKAQHREIPLLVPEARPDPPLHLHHPSILRTHRGMAGHSSSASNAAARHSTAMTYVNLGRQILATDSEPTSSTALVPGRTAGS